MNKTMLVTILLFAAGLPLSAAAQFEFCARENGVCNAMGFPKYIISFGHEAKPRRNIPESWITKEVESDTPMFQFECNEDYMGDRPEDHGLELACYFEGVDDF